MSIRSKVPLCRVAMSHASRNAFGYSTLVGSKIGLRLLHGDGGKAYIDVLDIIFVRLVAADYGKYE